MDDLAISFGLCFDGVFDQPGEAMADGAGGTAVEAEDIFVEIALQMFGADRTVMGAEQPALGETEDEVDGRQAQAGVAPALFEIDDLVGVALFAQPLVAGPSVGADGLRRRAVVAEEALQALGGGVGHGLEPEASERAFSPAT